MRMVLFAISSKLIFYHFIYHTLVFIIPSSFPSYFTSITFITTHSCFSFLFASMFFIHSCPSIPISFFLSLTSITLTLIHFHSSPLIPFHHFHSFSCPLLTLHCHTFSGIIALHYLPFSFISSIFILIPMSSILHIPFISFFRLSSSFIYYEI